MQLEVMRTSIEMQMAKHEEARKALESATRVKETEIDIRNKRGAGKEQQKNTNMEKLNEGLKNKNAEQKLVMLKDKQMNLLLLLSLGVRNRNRYSNSRR